ncbi:hypothetical protein HanPI659440_Chr14g0557431 [Helianthus annuus]|nr:hypothetical protein HanPI659440_Chr14g0557431 [Helianthus annuus]
MRDNLGKHGEFFDGILDCFHEITVALAIWESMRVNESAYRVDTTLCLAQWRIHNLMLFTYRKSDPLKIGKWNCIQKIGKWVWSGQVDSGFLILDFLKLLEYVMMFLQTFGPPGTVYSTYSTAKAMVAIRSATTV